METDRKVLNDSNANCNTVYNKISPEFDYLLLCKMICQVLKSQTEMYQRFDQNE